MQRYRKQTWINAPPEAVFETLAKPDVWHLIIPSITEREIEETREEGYRVSYTYKLTGVKINGTLETVAYEPPEQLVVAITGGMRGQFIFALESQGTGTRVSFEAEYEFTGTVLDRVIRPFAVRYNTRQFDSLLANLKDLLETKNQPA